VKKLAFLMILAAGALLAYFAWKGGVFQSEVTQASTKGIVNEVGETGHQVGKKTSDVFKSLRFGRKR